MSASLATTHDTLLLVPGDTAAARDLARRLDMRADSYEVSGQVVRQIDTVGAWQGVAADRSHATIESIPRRLAEAADAHRRAAAALTVYADTVEGARVTATEAVTLWQHGEQQTAAARALELTRPGPGSTVVGAAWTATTPASAADPGAAARTEAVALLASAQASADAAGDTAADIVTEAADVAPEDDGFWDQVGGVWSDVWHGAADVGADLGNAIMSFGNALLQNPDIVLELLAGAGMMSAGSTLMAGGVALDATGVGAIAGVPANVLGAGLIAAGGGTLVHGGMRAANEASGESRVDPFDGPARGGGWRSPDAAPEAPPTRVTGYTDHATQRSAERDFGRQRIEETVDNPEEPPRWQPGHQTWLYKRDGLRVTVNENGEIVTVFGK